MLQFYRCLLGEFKKRKRSVYLLLHLGVPFILPVLLVLYFLARDASISSESSYAILFELIGVGTPIIISILCGIVADVENEAGHFQNMLGGMQGRITSFLSQTTMMIFSYTAAIFLTISIYTVAMKSLVGVDEVYFTHSYLTGIIFAMTSIFQYFFYQFIGYKYGIGICSICGFGGMIIAALCLTTIGDKVWGFLPWAWANRFSEYLSNDWKMIEINWDSNPMLITGGFSFLTLTIGMILLSIIWFSKWDGRKTND